MLWALVSISLLLNLIIITALIFILMAGRQIASDVAGQLEGFGRQTINYKFRITQTVPVQARVPFRQSRIVPYSYMMPVSTTVNVTKELPVIGQINFDVPIRVDIPVSLTIPIEISETIPVNANVPLNLEIPLEIPIKDTPLKTMIDGIVKTLNQLAGR